MKYKIKRIAITGAGRGIGLAIAKQAALLNSVETLYLLGRNTAEIDTIIQTEGLDDKAVAIHFDLDKPEQFSEIIQQFEKLGFPETIIHNAGTSQRSNYINTSSEVFYTIFNRNFNGTEAFTRELLPKMKELTYSKFIVISSIAGLFGFPLRSAYSASKHALKGLFETIRFEEESNGVSVLMVYPGRIQTDISKHALNSDGKKEGLLDAGQANGMPVDICAKQIIKGIQSNKKELLVGKSELLMVFFKKFIPSVFYRIVRRISSR